MFRSRGTPPGGSRYSENKTRRTRNGRDFDPRELSEVVEVNVKKKKRSRCILCGEQWWDIGPSFILEHMGFEPGREVQKKYAKCGKINDPENSVWREKCAAFHANTIPVTAREGRELEELEGRQVA